MLIRPLSTDSTGLTMNYENIPTPLKTTTATATTISIDIDIDEYLLKIYENLNKIMPISFVFILFVCVIVGWILYLFCYSDDNDVEESQILDPSYIHLTNKIKNSKKYAKKILLIV